MIQQSQKNNWQTKKLGKVCNIVMGQSPLSIAYNEDCVGLPLVQGNNDIKKGKTIERIYTSEITKTSEKDSIILTVRAPVGCIGIAHKKVCIGRGVCSISTKKENQKFIFYFLKFFEPKWASLEQGSTFTAVNSSDIRKLKILLPSLPEQNRIVAILEIWDKYLEKLSRKIEIKKDIKKGIASQIMNCELSIVNGKKVYTPKLRLPGFSGGWESVKLGEVIDFKNGKAHEKNIVENGKYIVVNSKFVSSDAKVVKCSDKNLTPLFKDDIVMVMSDVPNGKAIAKCFLIDEDERYTLNQRICLIKPKKDNSKFLFYILNRNKYFLQFDDGVKQTNLRKDDILDCPIKLPPLKEQIAIAKILTIADKEIETLEKKKKIIEGQKKFLLNNLVTGKIKVNCEL